MAHEVTSERRGAGGFTLLEIIVTLVVLTVVLGAVSPVFIYSVRASRQEQALRDFVAYLKYAQECAVAKTLEYRVYIDPNERAFWVMYFAPQKDGSLELVPAEEPFAGRRHFPDDFELEDPKARWDDERDAFYIACHATGACDFATVKIRYGRHARFELKTEGNLGVFDIEEKKEE